MNVAIAFSIAALVFSAIGMGFCVATIVCLRRSSDLGSENHG